MPRASRPCNPFASGCSKCSNRKLGCFPSCHKSRVTGSCHKKGGKKAEKGGKKAGVSLKRCESVEPIYAFQGTFPDALVESTKRLEEANRRSKGALAILESRLEEAHDLAKVLALTVDTLQTKIEKLKPLALGKRNLEGIV